jgi:hypothetical protein
VVLHTITTHQVAPGEVTLVTGVPNSGKSEWLDALIVNLAEAHGWRFALASMEKAPVHHVRQLVEKRLRKPFFSAGYAQGVERMSQEVWTEAGRPAGPDCVVLMQSTPWQATDQQRAAHTLPASASCSNMLWLVRTEQHPLGGLVL